MPFIFLVSACAQGRAAGEKPEASLKLSPEVVQGAVTFEPGTKDGAVVPEISAPRLRAIWVPEKVDGNRLIEAHREWEMQGEPQLLGIPKDASHAVERTQKAPLVKPSSVKPTSAKLPSEKSSGGNHEN